MNCVVTVRRSAIAFHHYVNKLQLAKCVNYSSYSTNIDREKGTDGHYDVVLVGGGPAGLSMACAIGNIV